MKLRRAQLFVKPVVADVDEEEALGAEDVSVIHHRGQPGAAATPG